jgi:hypothetical protein
MLITHTVERDQFGPFFEDLQARTRVIGAWPGAIEELQRQRRNRVNLPDYGLAISPQSQTRASQAELLKVRRGVLRGCPWLSRGQGCEGTVVHGGIHSWYRLLQSPVPECD